VTLLQFPAIREFLIVIDKRFQIIITIQCFREQRITRFRHVTFGLKFDYRVHYGSHH